NGSNVSQSISSSTAVSQAFVYRGQSNYDVNQISLLLKHDADAAVQDIQIELLRADLSQARVQTINSSLLTTEFAWKTINFSDFSLTSADTFYIRITTANADGKIYVARSDSDIWNESEVEVNGVGYGNSDLKLKVSFNDGIDQPSTI